MQTSTKLRESKRAKVALIVPESAVFRFSFCDVTENEQHSMPTLRAYITHDLLRATGILEEDKGFVDLIYSNYVDLLTTRGWKLTQNELTDAMQRSSGGPTDHHMVELRKAGANECDNPMGPGVYDYSRAIVAASVSGAFAIIDGYKIAINWSGGMHHACYEKMSGFCYLNDISEAIKVLLTKFQSVLYIDIDVHHGDGVEEDWKLDSRVITCSCHYFDGLYFPSTGWEPITVDDDTGNVRINLPMSGQFSDEKFMYLMDSIVRLIVNQLQPDVIVLQSGADSLAGDPLGVFNLSGVGHSSVITICKSLNLPMLVVGGGGYNLVNVPRAWALETAIATEERLPPWEDMIPKCGKVTRYIMKGADSWVPVDFHATDDNSSDYLENLIHYVARALIKRNERLKELSELTTPDKTTTSSDDGKHEVEVVDFDE